MNVSFCYFGLASVMREDDSSSLPASEFEGASTGEESFMLDSDDINTSIHSTLKSTTSSSPVIPVIATRNQVSPTSSVSGSPPFTREDNSWHYSFEIPWNKMPSNTRKLLDTGKRPSPSERREIIRIVVAEILTVCKKPGKRHITEIARNMVIRYPKSFQDEIEGQVVGTGYDSLVKQFLSRIDNYRRLQAPPAQKRLFESDSPDNAKKKSTERCVWLH